MRIRISYHEAGKWFVLPLGFGSSHRSRWLREHVFSESRSTTCSAATICGSMLIPQQVSAIHSLLPASTPVLTLVLASCPKCDHGRAYFYMLQIRSADEPMTTCKCLSFLPVTWYLISSHTVFRFVVVSYLCFFYRPVASSLSELPEKMW